MCLILPVFVFNIACIRAAPIQEFQTDTIPIRYEPRDCRYDTIPIRYRYDTGTIKIPVNMRLNFKLLLFNCVHVDLSAVYLFVCFRLVIAKRYGM